MKDPLEDQDDASTPLTEEERQDLIPSYIALRPELNEAEQDNILEAEEWAFSRTRDVLDERFLRGLHKRMFHRVWRWAGKFRQTERNIGIDAYRIAPELRQLIDDCRYWVEHGTYDPDEVAVRFHHRLVSIHPFPNGNGRHARMATDLLLVSMGRPRFTWGRANLVDPGETRQRYVDALRAADHRDIRLLFAFARS
ncbi:MULTISPECIES: mobile mystery protein B [unclassified Thioalkalivibrio]|uniref:mobile mystery protein B n=1 Tax=unclassified Thioalkalivibrio TaxID=2621013 RepID=UPI00036B17DA|nr:MULTISPECIES: mobile mystery protein B [unclassified Thioalkalivibrio]